MKPRIFIVIGPSGSGKGTQAKLLKEYLEKNDSREAKYFQTGQAFRDLAAGDSYTSKLLSKVMTTGNLVPIFLPVWAWTNFFVKEYSALKKIGNVIAANIGESDTKAWYATNAELRSLDLSSEEKEWGISSWPFR